MTSKSRRVLISTAVAALVAASGLFGAGRTAPAPAAALKFEVVPTALFVKDGAALKQMVNVVVENGGAETAGELAVRTGGRDLTFPLPALAKGTSSHPVALPEVVRPTQAAFTLKAAGSTVSKTVTLKPARKWTVYLFHHSHTDIGYTELRTRVASNHVEYLDSVIDYCRQTDGYPDDAKFRWNIEVSWALQQYLKNRPPAKVQELVDLIKAGRVELSGLYLNQSDGFSHEEIIRSVDLARELAQKYGFDVVAAMNNDVTGFAWSLPQVMRQAGVKYFATGINETRSLAPLRRPNAFWWESPDGSRILHWNGEHYLFGNYDLLLHEPVAKSSPKVGEYLAKLEARGDYAMDAIAFNVGAWTTDNCPPGRALSDRVKEWNETYAYPKLRLATMREFFGTVEARFGASLPVYKLGWPDYWTDGVASTAFETGLNRVTHNDLISAEKWSAAAASLDKGFRYPADEIRQAYELAMLYDEHTWGAWNSIDDPGSEMARGQWALKSEFAYRAREMSRTLLKRGSEALAGLIATGALPLVKIELENPGKHLFAVLNPLSWPRTDVVRLALPAGPLRDAKGKLQVIDVRTGKEAPFQMAGEDAILVEARDVLPLGYAVFEVALGDASPGAVTEGQAARVMDNVIENRYYRVTIDMKTGGIASLFDKELGLDLVDKASPWPLNTYIYEQPEGGRKAVDDMTKRAVFHRWTPEGVKVEPGWRGPVASSLIVRSSAKLCPKVEQRIVLYNGVKRVDLVNVLDKEETFTPEAGYFAFPFRVAGESAAAREVPFTTRFEIANADMAPESEQLPGTTRDWQTVQHWVEFSGRTARVVWSPVDAPLIELGDINTGKWLKKLDVNNAWVFSYAMNNYWMTNFKAAQGGRLEFRYALTSGAPYFGERSGPAAAKGAPVPTPVSDRVSSTRFGWETHTPLGAIWLPEKAAGRLGAPWGSFASVDKPNVIIQAFLLDADGRPVVRLREIAGIATEVRISSPVYLGMAQSVEGGEPTLPVSLKPFEIKTVKLSR